MTKSGLGQTCVRLASVVVSAGWLLGCASSAGDLPEAQQGNDESALIKRYLSRERGIDAQRVSVREDRVFIDEDGFFEKDLLLDEIAAVGFDAAPGSSEQGYYYNARAGQNFAPRAAPAYFRFTAAVPETWRSAFRAAATAWSSPSSTDCVNFFEGDAPTGVSQITIGVGDAGIAADGNRAEAVSSFPFMYMVPKGTQYRLVGRTITIDTASVNEPSSGWRLHTALHEMGHSLGFTHPWDGFQIGGTKANTNDGCCSANYFTVMDYFGDEKLSSDDLASLAKMFRKQTVPIGKIQTLTCAYNPIFG